MSAQHLVAQRKIEDSFRKAGIQEGDILLVHSDTDILAQFLPDGSLIDHFSLLEKCLREILGPDGTLIVPTFTYSFCEGRRFDPVKRNSAVGLFTNYIRRRDDAFRSHHPVFSFAAIGKHAKEITANVSEYGFGVDSVFDRITKMRGKIACFNIDFQKCCTFVHYIEEIHGVDYRYHKAFTGEIVINGVSQSVKAINYVRDLERNIISDFDQFAEMLESRGVMSRTPLDEGFLLIYPCQATFDMGAKALTGNPNIFLASPSNL